VETGQLVHGPLRWKVIVLPAVSTLPEAAWRKLEAFVHSGGKLIALELMPENSEDRFPDAQLQAAFADLFQNGKDAVFIRDWTPAALEGILGSWLDKAIELSDESLPLRMSHRRINGRDLFFVFNDSRREVHTDMTLRAKGRLEEWDPKTGDINPVGNPASISLMPYHGKIYRTR
jgi:hypothetical protein